MKKANKSMKIFDTKSVLIVYIVCNAITVLTLLASITTTIFIRNQPLIKMLEHMGLCVIAILFYNIPIFIRLKYKITIPSFLEIIVTIMAIAHFVLGEIFRVYDYSLLFDKLLHTTSGIIFAVIGFSLVNIINSNEMQIMKLSPFFVALFSFCFSLAIGYVWELFEFSVDTLAGANMQRWQDGFVSGYIDGQEQLVAQYAQGNGLTDTMGDMIVNAIGALFISIIGYIYLRRNKGIDRLLIMPNSHNQEAKDTEKKDENEGLRQ